MSTAATCPGSGMYPTRWPGWGENQKAPCPVCGEVVTVSLRRYDHNRRPEDLVVAPHAHEVRWDGRPGGDAE